MKEKGRIEIKLVGHVSMELIIIFTMQVFSRKGCHLEFSPTGSRYLEDGLVVPRKYLASAEDKKLIAIRMNSIRRQRDFCT